MQASDAVADFSNSFQLDYDGERGTCAIRFRCFDTPNSVTVHGCPQPDYELETLLLGVRQFCLDCHFLWSFSLPGSDVARVNRRSSSVEVDPRTACLIGKMKGFHEREPLFDFTVGPVSYLWKHARSVPGDGELAEALSHVGAGLVAVDGARIVKADPLAQVDVGGAAKGFAADEVVRLLRQGGVESADVDLGGNLFMMGAHPSGRDWRVAVRVPQGIDAGRVVVQVRDKSVVTSGSYERFAEIDGVRYQHIIDVRTGLPARSDIVSATVVADSSLTADLLATTALLCGSSGLGELAARHPDCGFVAICEGGEVVRIAA